MVNYLARKQKSNQKTEREGESDGVQRITLPFGPKLETNAPGTVPQSTCYSSCSRNPLLNTLLWVEFSLAVIVLNVKKPK